MHLRVHGDACILARVPLPVRIGSLLDLNGPLVELLPMARVVECARGVSSKQTQPDGMPFKMPTISQVGGALWYHMKSKFNRGEEFARAMGWTVDQTNAFIAECKSKRSMTPSAVRQREASAKRKREALLNQGQNRRSHRPRPRQQLPLQPAPRHCERASSEPKQDDKRQENSNSMCQPNAIFRYKGRV